MYREAIASPLCSVIYLTEIEQEFDCDTFFPALEASKWRLWSSSPPRRDKGTRFSFLCYVPASQEARSAAAACCVQLS